MSGSSSTSRRSRARTSPPAPGSPASAACRCSSCCGPSATTRRRTRLPRALRHATSTSSRASGRRSATSPRPGTRRCVEIYKRARPGEPPRSSRPGPTSRTPSSTPSATTSPGSAATSSTASSARRSRRSPSILDDRPRAPRARARACSARREMLAAYHLPAPPGQRRAGLPPRRPGPLRQPPHPLGGRADPEPGPHRPVPHGAGRPRAHDHPGRRGHHAPDPDQHPPRGRRHQGVLRHQPAVASSWTRPTRCRAWPTSAACRPSAPAVCPVSGPGSRSATCTPATTAACARSRPRRARTSASSAPWPPTPGSTTSASSRRPTARWSTAASPTRSCYLAADEEEEYVIAQANAALDADGTFAERPGPRPPRPAGRRRARRRRRRRPTAPPARSTTCRRPRSTSWTSRPSRSSRWPRP